LPNFLLFKPHPKPLSKREGRIFGKPLAFGEGFGVRLKKEPNSPALERVCFRTVGKANYAHIL
jgi:hypothetical protein